MARSRWSTFGSKLAVPVSRCVVLIANGRWILIRLQFPQKRMLLQNGSVKITKVFGEISIQVYYLLTIICCYFGDLFWVLADIYNSLYINSLQTHKSIPDLAVRNQFY